MALELETFLIIAVLGVVLYLIFHVRECHKFGCEPFAEADGWELIGNLYSQKAGDTRKIGLEKGPGSNKYRAVDYKRKLMVPVDTRGRELHDGQLISIQGYEKSNPFLIEMGKSMKFEYSMASY